MGLLNPVAGIQRKAKSVSTIRKGNRNREGGREGERKCVAGSILSLSKPMGSQREMVVFPEVHGEG